MINALNLILLVIVLLILWRLRNVLGTHADSDPKKRDMFVGPKNPVGRRSAAPGLRVVTEGETPAAAGGLNEILAADNKFNVAQFLENVTEVYEIILTAYAAHDRDTLKPLISKDVFDGFAEAIEAREAQGQSLQTTLSGLSPLHITDAELTNGIARITVRIEAELITVLRDKEDNIIQGNVDKAVPNIDLWTFERRLKSRSPIWILVATETAIDET